MRGLVLLTMIVFQFMSARGGEGMWLPVHIDSLKLEDMQRLGFALVPAKYTAMITLH